MTFAVETEHLTKRYGELLAVNDLNVAIEEGEIFGLLGPNGAGKTTTLSMLATSLNPRKAGRELMATMWDLNRRTFDARSA